MERLDPTPLPPFGDEPIDGLPKVTLGFETAFYTGERVLHRQVLHSVVIEPDARRVSMVWQTTLMCHTQVLNLDHTEVLEKVRVSVRAA